MGLGAAGAAALVGCSSSARTAGLPSVPWPNVSPRPEPPRPTPPRAPIAEAGPDGVITRTAWTRAKPIASRVNPMNGIRRITLHHEGAADSPVYFTDYKATAKRIALVRRVHMERGWGDIGYHYIVDRAGRVWAARPLELQGAHVRDNNEHNIGIMCLGNFDIQAPSDAQLKAVTRFTRDLRHSHRVPVARIHTHQELVATSCPGRSMQPRIAMFRSNGNFA